MSSKEEMIQKIKDHYGLDSPHVLSAMEKIPREEFVDKEFKGIAYHDRPVPIGQGQTMSQPYTVAFMTDLLDLKGHEKVLEIGTGSGYQAAVLSLLADKVYTVEIIKSLAKKAKTRLKKLGYGNVVVKVGDGQKGWKRHAPYDRILITAGIEGEVPREFFDQLKNDGVLIAPVGKGMDKKMVKYKKDKKGKISQKEYGTFHFVPFV